MIIVCPKCKIAYIDEDFPSGCPVENLHELIEGLQKELREARAALKGMYDYDEGEAGLEEGECTKPITAGNPKS